MTLLRSSDPNSSEINIALLSLEADIKKLSNNSSIDKQLADINKRIDEINKDSGGSIDVDEIKADVKKLKNDVIAINSDITNINSNIDNIEQQLSNIFTAENKTTDFNTTTDSGIYYWIDDAANKPDTGYGVLLVNKYSTWINQIAYGTNGRIYFRQKINDNNWTEWKAIAYYDETEKTTSLSTVTTSTTKYIKLGVFNWSDSFSFKCRIYGNGFEDRVNVNILSGHSTKASVCGYYSTNNKRTQAVIVKRAASWNDNFEIYLKIYQATTANITITVEKTYQNRIAISESTTAPTGTLEEIAFNNVNGMFSSSIDAKNLILEGNTDANLSNYGKDSLSIGFPSGTNDGKSLGFDRNSIQARTNGAATYMYLNYYGGMVSVNEQNKSDGGLKVKQKMVIPTSAPSTKENGCIWIE